MTSEAQWLIYRGSGEPHDAIADLPEAPPWRRFDGEIAEEPAVTSTVGSRQIGRAHV